jgi:hypothetical protein
LNPEALADIRKHIGVFPYCYGREHPQITNKALSGLAEAGARGGA